MPLWARRVRRKRRLGSSARPQWQERGWDDLCHSPSIRGGGPCEEGGVAEGQRRLRGGGVHCSIPRVSKKIFANRKCRQIGREGGKPDQGLVDQCPQLSQRLTLQGIVFSEPQGSPTRPCSVSLRRARQSWADSSRSGKGLQNVTILMD